MQTGSFNADEYLERLHEGLENTGASATATGDIKDGILMPDGDVTRKSFDWLKKEYQKGAVEVKVEVSGQGSSFSPGFDLQTDVDSVKDFKPGAFGSTETTGAPEQSDASPKADTAPKTDTETEPTAEKPEEDSVESDEKPEFGEVKKKEDKEDSEKKN